MDLLLRLISSSAANCRMTRSDGGDGGVRPRASGALRAVRTAPTHTTKNRCWASMRCRWAWQEEKRKQGCAVPAHSHENDVLKLTSGCNTSGATRRTLFSKRERLALLQAIAFLCYRRLCPPSHRRRDTLFFFHFFRSVWPLSAHMTSGMRRAPVPSVPFFSSLAAAVWLR